MFAGFHESQSGVDRGHAGSESKTETPAFECGDVSFDVLNASGFECARIRNLYSFRARPARKLMFDKSELLRSLCSRQVLIRYEWL